MNTSGDHAYNCGANAAIVGECSCSLTTPTPGDLSARLQELVQRVSGICTNEDAARWCLGFVVQYGESISAALSALPAAGGAKPRPVAWYVFAGTEHWVTHDEDEAEGNRAGGCEVRPLIFGDTTPQPSAAVHEGVGCVFCDLNTDHRAPCTAVGAQGDGDAVAELLAAARPASDAHEAERLHPIQANVHAANKAAGRLRTAIAGMESAAPAAHRDFIEEVNPAGDRTGYFLFAPAAGKGVDDAALGRAYRRWYGAAKGYKDMDADAAHDFITREAALTRQPVAGDGK